MTTMLILNTVCKMRMLCLPNVQYICDHNKSINLYKTFLTSPSKEYFLLLEGSFV